jgi:hypothetical protein
MMAASAMSRFDAFIDRGSEWFNPVLVKETRQVLKSRTFPFTFLAMLVGAWVLSLAGVVPDWERVQMGETGPGFFRQFYLILMAALCLVVPLGVFRNVVAEFEGQTFETLAVTTLRPARIVSGKLQSAVVQMAAYYSAVAPFLCFTYLLKGLSLPGIALALVVSFLAAMLVCLAAAALGALAKQSVWQMPALLVLMGWATVVFACGAAFGSGLSRMETGIGLANLVASLGCFGYFLLFYTLLTLGIAIAQFTPTSPQPGAGASSPYSRPRPRTTRPPVSSSSRPA